MDRFWHLVSPAHFPTAILDRLHLVGFSQGAALAYTIGLQYPSRVALQAGLSGFLPLGADDLVGAPT